MRMRFFFIFLFQLFYQRSKPSDTITFGFCDYCITRTILKIDMRFNCAIKRNMFSSLPTTETSSMLLHLFMINALESFCNFLFST